MDPKAAAREESIKRGAGLEAATPRSMSERGVSFRGLAGSAIKAARLMRQSTSNIAAAMRDVWRSAAIQKVNDALAGKAASSKTYELERHGARLALVVVLHTLNTSGELQQKRHVGWLADNATWPQFLDQIGACASLGKAEIKELRSEFKSEVQGLKAEVNRLRQLLNNQVSSGAGAGKGGDLKNTICYKCGQKGHRARDCPNSAKDEEKKAGEEGE